MTSKLLKVSTGIHGLDEICAGGFISRQSYLLRGGPGTGKSTLALQFLALGATCGESA